MAYASAADGTRIAYSSRGDGPQNVLFLHAWGASGRYFDETIDNLDLSGRRAITIDFRGHGDSDKQDSALSWDLLADDVLAVGDSAAARRFVAVGHSMGGKLAQYLTVVEPQRIEGLVLVASPSAGTLPIPDAARGWTQFASNGQALLTTSVLPFLRRPVPRDVLDRFAREAARIPRTYLERTIGLITEASFIERLNPLPMPVLIISSAHDPIHTTEGDLIGSFPNARFEQVDAGTEIPMEEPAVLARLLDRFLTDIAAG